jgi:hypothetical protein
MLSESRVILKASFVLSCTWFGFWGSITDIETFSAKQLNMCWFKLSCGVMMSSAGGNGSGFDVVLA